MATIGEHEGAAVSEELGRLVDASPRRDVICRAGDDIAVHIYLAHVERYAAHVKLTSADERIGIDEIEKIGMQAGGQSRRVVVPVEDVEGGRRIAEQVI